MSGEVKSSDHGGYGVGSSRPERRLFDRRQANEPACPVLDTFEIKINQSVIPKTLVCTQELTNNHIAV